MSKPALSGRGSLSPQDGDENGKGQTFVVRRQEFDSPVVRAGPAGPRLSGLLYRSPVWRGRSTKAPISGLAIEFPFRQGCLNAASAYADSSIWALRGPLTGCSTRGRRTVPGGLFSLAIIARTRGPRIGRSISAGLVRPVFSPRARFDPLRDAAAKGGTHHLGRSRGTTGRDSHCPTACCTSGLNVQMGPSRRTVPPRHRVSHAVLLLRWSAKRNTCGRDGSVRHQAPKKTSAKAWMAKTSTSGEVGEPVSPLLSLPLRVVPFRVLPGLALQRQFLARRTGSKTVPIIPFPRTVSIAVRPAWPKSSRGCLQGCSLILGASRPGRPPLKRASAPRIGGDPAGKGPAISRSRTGTDRPRRRPRSGCPPARPCPQCRGSPGRSRGFSARSGRGSP